MPTMMIVDDESIFRKGIAHLVNGFDLDWEVVGEARDGLEALEQVQRLRPDLVITDIRMPRMDGLELQSALAEKAPDTKCIVLSGYNDFKYVQTSIRTGVRDYLLKPINKDELYQTLERMLGEWRKSRRETDKESVQAELALLSRLTDGGNRVLAYGEAAANPSAVQSAKNWDIPELMIAEGNAAVLRQHICKTLLQCYEMAVNRGVVQEWLGDRDMIKVLEEALSITSRTELTGYYEQMVLSLSAILHEQGRDHVTHAVDKVVAYIEAHYAEPVTLSMMADMVYLNASYLSSLFKARLGCSFVEVLTRRRIREACRRLAHTSEKIVLIAERTGFANLRHFNRVFKTETGRTPKQYREEMQNKNMA